MDKQDVENKFSTGSGVAAVVGDGVEMRLNDLGFFEEVLDNRDAQLLEKVSSMSGAAADESEIAKSLYADLKGISHNNVLGYYLDLYAGHVVEGDYRDNASSGGFTTWLPAFCK